MAELSLKCVLGESEREEDQQGWGDGQGRGVRLVAPVLLAEAHVAVPGETAAVTRPALPAAVPVPLRHAGVVDHEEVDLEVGVCAGPPDLVVL